ncbi:Tolloid-like protein 1 [Aphelenchoides fujianensis]|nr:Tolloid-like protein 1 [Aphelenchoides fujianensis]
MHRRDPNPCPENPIVLTGSDFPQFIYSPYDELHHYPPNTDCRFVLVARNLQRRIQVNVIDSQLEEPLFTDCKDYVKLRDGAHATSQEIVYWCGRNYWPAVTSTGDSLYVHFHSDNIIQSRGFNMSFVDYDIPGCPPDWTQDPEGVYCYKLVDAVQGFTFVDAQKACVYERANLLTIESAREYTFIVNQYSTSHSFPWIGYNDGNREGVFETNRPQRAHVARDDKDCVFLDWNVRDGTAHSVDDCRNRRPFICKKRQDGTTVPIQLSSTLVRYGYRTSSFDYFLLLILLILFVILLIIIWIVYQKCKNRNAVATVDRGAELGRRETSSGNANKAAKNARSSSAKGGRSKTTTKTATTDAVKRIIDTNATRTTPAAEEALQKMDEQDRESNGSGGQAANNVRNRRTGDRIRTKLDGRLTPEQTVEIDDTTGRSVTAGDSRSHSPTGGPSVRDQTTETEAQSTAADRSRLYVETKSKTAATNTPGTSLGAVLPPVGEPPAAQREQTNLTGISSSRSRLTHPPNQTFERPHVGTLDNVSAISMDEFWQTT